MATRKTAPAEKASRHSPGSQFDGMPLCKPETLAQSLHSRLERDEVPQDDSACLGSSDIQDYDLLPVNCELVSMDFYRLNVEFEHSNFDLTSMSVTPESELGHIPEHSTRTTPVKVDSAIGSDGSDGSTASSPHVASNFQNSTSHSLLHITRGSSAPEQSLAPLGTSMIKPDPHPPSQRAFIPSRISHFWGIPGANMDNQLPHFSRRGQEIPSEHSVIPSTLTPYQWTGSTIAPPSIYSPFMYHPDFMSPPLPLALGNQELAIAPDHTPQFLQFRSSYARYSERYTSVEPRITRRSPLEESSRDRPYARIAPVLVSSPNSGLSSSPSQEDKKVKVEQRIRKLPSTRPQRQVQAAKPTGTSTADNPPPPARSHRSQARAGAQASRDLRAQKTQKKRTGGRKPGSNLEPGKRANAKTMRVLGSCWYCILQREPCDSHQICTRCQKRQRSYGTSNFIRGCNRTKISEIGDFLIPAVLSSTHNNTSLEQFERANIKAWTGRRSAVQLVCIQDLPAFEVVLEEFESATEEPLWKWQKVYNPSTRSREGVERPSRPLGMRISKDGEEYQKLGEQVENYVSQLADDDGCFEEIASKKFSDEEDDFQTQLLLLLRRLAQKDDCTDNCYRDVFHLLVIVYIHDHTIRMKGENTSPRMANRQLKLQFHNFLHIYMRSILKRVNSGFHKSVGRSRWLLTFCSIIGLAIAIEDLQRTAHIWYESLVAEGKSSEWEAARKGEEQCRKIEEPFWLMVDVFRTKYKEAFNPLRNCNDQKMEKELGSAGMGFVRELAALIDAKHAYLHQKRFVEISVENQELYTNRLVAQVLVLLRGPPPQSQLL